MNEKILKTWEEVTKLYAAVDNKEIMIFSEEEKTKIQEMLEYCETLTAWAVENKQ